MSKEFHYHQFLSFERALELMLEQRRPFQVERTGSSISLVNDSFAWIIADHRFWPKYLRELSILKGDIRRNTKGVDYSEHRPPRGFQVAYAQFQTGVREFKTDELDLSKAYISAAQKLGVISPRVYDRLAGLRKEWRLRVLGAIARKKRTVLYNGEGVIIGKRTDFDAQFRGVWFAICKEVDNKLAALAQAVYSTFLFYWYDNLFSLRGGLTSAALSAVGYQHRVRAGTLRTVNGASNLIALTDDGRKFFLPSVYTASSVIQKFQEVYDVVEIGEPREVRRQN